MGPKLVNKVGRCLLPSFLPVGSVLLPDMWGVVVALACEPRSRRHVADTMYLRGRHKDCIHKSAFAASLKMSMDVLSCVANSPL